MKAVVFGYGNMGVAGMEALCDTGVQVERIYTHRARHDDWEEFLGGAGYCLNIPVMFESPSVAGIAMMQPDMIFSFYYKNIIPQGILDIPRLGAYNLHGSLLPKYRGRCPLNWAILKGESMTGVTLHHMTEKVDAGDIVCQEPVHINRYDGAIDVHRRIVDTSYKMLKAVLPAIMEGKAPRIPQDHSRATYYGGRTPDMGRIDWSMGEIAIHNLVRAVAPPWPGAFSFMGDTKVIIEEALPRAYHWVADEIAPLPPGTIGFDGNRPLVWCGEGALYLGAIEVDGEYLAYKKLMDWCKAHDGRVFV